MSGDPWTAKVGAVWTCLLKAQRLRRDATVIEVGPGFTEKIGIALAGLRFRGTLFVVEPNPAALRHTLARYRNLLDGSRVVGIGQTVAQACQSLPDRVDALLMNHVLDDMVLYASLGPEQRERVFSAASPTEDSAPAEFHQAWGVILADPETLRVVRRRVVDELIRLRSQTAASIFGVSQYQSWFLTRQGLGSVDLLGARLLEDLKRRLGQTSATHRAILQNQDQDPDRWLFLHHRLDHKEAG